jgi:cytochrome c oxidase subunit 4
MAEHAHEPNYMLIWYWLIALTILEIVVALISFPILTKGILLVGLAVTKAVLVALYFMHLRFERLTLAVIAATPMVICLFLVFMLLPDLGGVEHTTTEALKKIEGHK